MERKKRVIVEHTAQRPVHLGLYLFEWEGKPHNGVSHLLGSEEESEFYGADGFFAVWDGGAEFDEDYVRVSGSNGPSGGTHGVRVKIPYHLIKKLEYTTDYDSGPLAISDDVYRAHFQQVKKLVKSRGGNP